MSAPIQSLPTELVHLIAAGEVIDSLAAAVRELIDNALDAGATQIRVTIWPELWQVRVSDNGLGMTPADLAMAASPHTTSKLHTHADFGQIQTLGFRGEALHSLAQLGNLEVCSRSQTTGGWRYVYDAQGYPQVQQPVAIAIGTVVTVSNLFAHWPTRRQEQPVPAQQLRAIQQLISQSALCHPRVTWQVFQGRLDGEKTRPWFSIAGAQTAVEILAQILPRVRVGDLRGHQQANLDLAVGLPDRCHRARPDWVLLAVNGRCVQVEAAPGDSEPATPLRAPALAGLLPGLGQTLVQAFQQTLPRHRYPVCFLHLRVPPPQVDWNRHPAKTQIYLQAAEFWQSQIQTAIGHTLELPLSQGTASDPVPQMLKAAETAGVYTLNRQVQPTHPELPATLIPLRAVGQVHQTYILAEHPAGMWLVEQHIAHERVLYEQLLAHWELVEISPPLTLSQLTPVQVEQLQTLGLVVESFGPQLWSIRSAPAMLAQRPDCAEALLELSLGTNLQVALVATACRSAIRNGTPLTLPEMQSLLDQWQQTRQPRTCPHGRPIYMPLAETALARFFRRHWVIEKSHGI